MGERLTTTAMAIGRALVEALDADELEDLTRSTDEWGRRFSVRLIVNPDDIPHLALFVDGLQRATVPFRDAGLEAADIEQLQRNPTLSLTLPDDGLDDRL